MRSLDTGLQLECPAECAVENSVRREFAALSAIEEINQQADEKPGEEADPGNDSQPHHQSAAEDDRNQREPGGLDQRCLAWS